MNQESEPITNNDKPFEPGEVIEYCDEHYEVLENFGDSGTVKDAGGICYKFRWFVYGEESKRVKTKLE